jgi:hypothetical protein
MFVYVAPKSDDLVFDLGGPAIDFSPQVLHGGLLGGSGTGGQQKQHSAPKTPQRLMSYHASFIS